MLYQKWRKLLMNVEEFLVKEERKEIIILDFSKWAPHLLPLHERARRNKRAPPLPGKRRKKKKKVVGHRFGGRDEDAEV
jgi:hypothetical protein